MKKHGILNSDISRILSYLRHKDCICICDCGMPCPDSTELIDISLAKNIPRFMDVLRILLGDLKVEKAFLAEEITTMNAAVLNEIKTELSSIPLEYMLHDTLKEKLTECKAVIRTGEASPYANIVLQAACIF